MPEPTPSPNPTQPAKAPKECDLIMKGGVTSGVVYPKLAAKLAEVYRFVNIGGTSAGAIAAAATAAAEFGRQSGKPDSFEKLNSLPEWLADSQNGVSNLQALFQSQKAFSALFQLIVSCLGKTGFALLKVAAFGLFKAAWKSILLCFAFTFVTLLALREVDFIYLPDWLLAALSMLIALVFGAAFSLIGSLQSLPANNFGFCFGPTEHNSSRAGLTSWLDEYYSDLAGLPTTLTFADLKTKAVRLRMMCTNLTMGRPFELPLQGNYWFFRKQEMQQYFPPRVVEHLVKHAQSTSALKNVELGDLLLLPPADQIPVVFGVRLSLSFPILFAAVPLYAINYSRARLQQAIPGRKRVAGDALDPDEPWRPEKCWFADGGICSNLPLHMFDAPLPNRPTFAINLRPQRADRPDLNPEQPSPKERVWLPKTNRSGIAHFWSYLATSPNISVLIKFLVGVATTGRTWMEETQTATPGFRDRVVTVYLNPHEGGMNLNMAPDLVKRLGEYGRAAAQRLIDHYGDLPTLSDGRAVDTTWDNQRWIRFRSTMTNLQKAIQATAHTLQVQNWRDLLHHPPSYQWESEAQRDELERTAEQFIDMAKGWKTDFAQRSPRPLPELRIMPSLESDSDA
jgi:predicted acylesterase/phospholipase RssA